MNADNSLLAFRKKWRGYFPWVLAKVRDVAMLYEFTSYPWENPDGQVLIHARPIDDPTGNRVFVCRREISPVRWSDHRQRAYKQGFKDGVAFAIQEAKKLRDTFHEAFPRRPGYDGHD